MLSKVKKFISAHWVLIIMLSGGCTNNDEPLLDELV
ncbi:uncharacterized protein METZ01_LOCUS200018, partial [marine metagenome]